MCQPGLRPVEALEGRECNPLPDYSTRRFCIA